MFYRSLFFAICVWLVLLVPRAEAAPRLSVAWATTQLNSVTIVLAEQGERAETCLSRGFEPRIRYRAQLCWRRMFWADSCSDQHEEYRSIQFDSVSDTYRLVRDKIGDKLEATQESVANFREAAELFSNIPELELAPLGWAKDDRRYYLNVRAVGDCKGEYSEMVTSIPYFLSLGLVRIGSVNTGWIRFDLGGSEQTLAPVG